MVSIMPFGRISTSIRCLHASDDTRTLDSNSPIIEQVELMAKFLSSLCVCRYKNAHGNQI